MDAAQHRRPSLRHWRVLIDSPRWLLLAALVYAPWAYGCTRPWTADVLSALLGGLVFLWLAGCAVRRTGPVISAVPLVASLLLIGQAWWMVLNAKSEYDAVALR